MPFALWNLDLLPWEVVRIETTMVLLIEMINAQIPLVSFNGGDAPPVMQTVMEFLTMRTPAPSSLARPSDKAVHR